MKLTKVLLTALALSASSCGGDSDGPSGPIVPARVNVTGTWQGPASTATLTLTIAHDTLTNAVTGQGTLVNANAQLALSIVGTFAAPTLALTMSSPGFQPLNLTATHAGATMTGTINGSGFNNSATTLTKR